MDKLKRNLEAIEKLGRLLRKWHQRRAGGILIKKAKRADFEISEHLGNYLRCVNEAGKLDLSTPRGLYILGMWQVSCMLETYAQSSFYEEIAKSRKRANLMETGKPYKEGCR